MAIITETSGGACLQLDLTGQIAAPEPSLRMLHTDEDTERAGGGSALAGRVPVPIEFDYHIAPGTGGHGRARADGLLAVIQAFACRVAVFGYDATRRDKFLIMVGTRPVLDALGLLLPSIARQMETTARAAAKEYGRQVRYSLPKMPSSRQCSLLKVPYFRDYLRGFGHGAAEIIRGARSDFIQAEGPELTQVLAEHDRLAAQVYNREFPHTHELRKEQAGHADGFQEGQDAGRSAHLGDGYLAEHDLVFAML